MDKKIQERIRDRRNREKENLKAAILKASRDLAVKEGWPDVSIRKIAFQIAYTPPVIYELFKNKEAILIEIETQGFRQLQYQLEEARQREGEPGKQVVEISKALWDWAFQHEEVYQVMFNLEGIHCTPTNPNSLKDCTQSLIECLRQIQLFSTETDSLFFNWWAIMHGHISLVISGQVAGRKDQMRRNMIQSVERFLKSLSN